MITLLDLRPYPGDSAAPSPNHGPRNADAIEGIVLHATQDAGNEAHALSWLRSPRSQVSAHLLVTRHGRVIRLVGDQQRAWHAGASFWRGRRDVNSITLGIEIANRNDGEPFTAAQYRRVADITAHYCRQGLSLRDVVSHGDIAPGRRTDPLGWDWMRFRALVNERLQPVPLRELPAPDTAATRPLGTPRSQPLGTPVGQAPAQPLGTPGVGRHALQLNAAPAARAAAAIAGVVAATPKPMLYSRTLWLNVITVLAAAAAIAAQTLELAFWVGLTVPEQVTMWALFALGVVNIVLRFWTTQPICTSAPARAPVYVDEAGRRRTSA